MKLEIHNFRCHENTEIELPDGKVSLLSGYSGQGKSSILESILFVLYDAIKKPFTFGKKKCSVSLYYKNYKITRQKGPNHLQITSTDVNLENEIAQNWILEEFGTIEQFYCACYIRQMEKHFLFTQSTNQIMDFIHTIAFGKDEINHWKDKLQEKKKEFEEHITKYDGRIQQHEMYIQSDTELDSLSKEDILKLEKKSIETREEEIQEFKNTILVKKEEKDKSIELFHKHQNKKRQVYDLKEQVEKYEVFNMKDLEQELESIMTKLRTPVSSVKQELKSVEQEFNKVKKSIGPNTKVDQKLPLLLQEKQLLDKVNTLLKGKSVQSLKDEVQNSSQTLSKLEQRAKDLEISLQNMQWSKIVEVDCPSCHTHLFFNQEKLLTEVEKPEKFEVPIPNATEKELGSVLQQVENLKPILEEKKALLNEVETLTLNVKWTQDLEKKIENYSKYVELNKKKTELTQKAENDKNFDSDQIQELELTRQDLQKKMKQVHQHEVLKSQYEAEKEKLNLLDHVSQDDLSSLDKEISKLNTELQEKIDNLCLLKKIIQNKKDNEVLEMLYIERRKWQQKSEACSYLKSKTQEAESLYLDEIMEQINIEINTYLEFIFDKTPMTLTFKTTKELKTKKESRPVFDIDIFYKNEQYDSIAQLSGGESAKCGIAILLAFNKILGTKFILLDESLNALDMESKLKVIDVLKSTGKTCVLISHDEIQGVFDKVLSL